MVGFCDSLALSLNENITNFVVYFDFAKALNSINHDILLHELKTLKIIYIYIIIIINLIFKL